MKLNVKITSMMCQALEQTVAEYNQWPHRSADAVLTDLQFEIELSDFPIFWQQFLENSPSVRKILKPICLDAMRKFPQSIAGPSLQKALEALE